MENKPPGEKSDPAETEKEPAQLMFRNLSFIEKFKYCKSKMSVEPIIGCYIMPSVLVGLATQNLNLEKACRVNLNYEPHVCDALKIRDTANYTVEEENVQRLVASMIAWKTVLQSALPCILILFWGSWSDRHGRRKPCMLVPIIGEFATAMGLILCTYFDRWPMEVAGVIEGLFPALTGGWFTMVMGVFSYIADVTTEEERTLRIGIVNLFFSVGVPIGMAVNGILLKEIGFYGVFSISATLYFISFTYGMFCLKEVPFKEKTKVDHRKSVLADFFDRQHVMETFRVAFKKGENRRRTRVIMLMIVVMVVVGPLHGDMAVIYLFTRYRFNWDEVKFSLWSTYSMITSLVGTICSVGVFSHLLQFDDSVIGIMSSMSKVLSSFVYAFATKTWHLYIGPLVEILNGTSFIAMRSMASKLVSSDELGKVNSLFGVAEALMPLVYAPMYTTLYQATMKTLPGAFFLLGGTLTIPAVIIFAWMYKVNKQIEVMRELEKNETAKSNGHQTYNNNNNNDSGDVEKQKTSNGTAKPATEKIMHDKEVSLIQRLGSQRKSIVGNYGYVNNAFVGVKDEGGHFDDKVIHETIEIVKDLPPLHIEHCKL